MIAARDWPRAIDRWLAPTVIVLLASPCLLLAYLPNERILIEADLFDSTEASDPPPTGATAANRTLLGHVQRLGLDVETIVPIHGSPVAWSEFAGLVGAGR